jgi:hypothetical protein
MAELRLNRPDGLYDFCSLGFIANQSHYQQILIRACVSCHALASPRDVQLCFVGSAPIVSLVAAYFRLTT